MFLASGLLTFAALGSLAYGRPAGQASGSLQRATIVHAFPNGTWVENVAVRSNGNLLVTLINLPEVWEVDPTNGRAELVYSFPNANVTLGITEVEQDVFAVNVGNFSVPAKGVPGSWCIWTLDYNSARHRSWTPGSGKPQEVVAKEVATLPSANFLNGLTALHASPGVVLAADSFLGVIFAVNVRTGAYTVAIDDPALKPNVSTPITLGVNGIHMYQNDLYFTNSLSTPLFAKVSLSKDGTAAGPVEVIAEKAQFVVDDGFQADDFALDHDGAHAWIVTNPTGDLIKIDIATGAQEVVAGGLSDPTFAGATGAAFGRTSKDREILYVVTDGGAVDPTASGLRGGRIVAFDTMA